MSNRHGRRSRPTTDHLHESIAHYLRMQQAATEKEFQELLREHDRCTDADGLPRLAARTLDQFRHGPGVTPG